MGLIEDIMATHHPNCAVTRQGDIRAFCDCKWPEVRAAEANAIAVWLLALDTDGDLNRYLPTTIANWIREGMHRL